MKDFKIAILGAGGVGKSSITARYVHNTFYDAYDPTIEDSYRKDILFDGRPITLEILDTAGIEQFRAMRELYIRSSDGFFLVYDVSNPASIEELRPLRDLIVSIKESKDMPVVLVGNKCDRCESGNVPQAAISLAKSWRVSHITTSAKANIRVAEAFTTLVQCMVGRNSMVGESIHSHTLSIGSTGGSFISSHKGDGHRKSILLGPRKFASSANLGLHSAANKVKRSHSIMRLKSMVSLRADAGNKPVTLIEGPPNHNQGMNIYRDENIPGPEGTAAEPGTRVNGGLRVSDNNTAPRHGFGLKKSLSRLRSSKSLRKLRSATSMNMNHASSADHQQPEIVKHVLRPYQEDNEDDGVEGTTYDQLNMAPDIITVPSETAHRRKKGRGCIIS